MRYFRPLSRHRDLHNRHSTYPCLPWFKTPSYDLVNEKNTPGKRCPYSHACTHLGTQPQPARTIQVHDCDDQGHRLLNHVQKTMIGYQSVTRSIILFIVPFIVYIFRVVFFSFWTVRYIPTLISPFPFVKCLANTYNH